MVLTNSYILNLQVANHQKKYTMKWTTIYIAIEVKYMELYFPYLTVDNFKNTATSGQAIGDFAPSHFDSYNLHDMINTVANPYLFTTLLVIMFVVAKGISSQVADFRGTVFNEEKNGI